MVLSLVYLCGGVSSRFGGEIKQFAKVGKNSETLIEVSINQALMAGEFSEIVFIVGEKTRQPFLEFFGNNYNGVPVKYAYQDFDNRTRDRPWGTADAFSTLKGMVNNPFIICNGDDLYGVEAYKVCIEFSKNKKCATVGYKLDTVLPNNPDESVNRGVFNVKDGYIINITEWLDISRNKLTKEQLDNYASMNFMLLTPDVIDMVYEKNIEFKKCNYENRKLEHFLPEVLSYLIYTKKIEMLLLTTSEKCIGITRPSDLDSVKEYCLKY
jgi:choline kinase